MIRAAVIGAVVGAVPATVMEFLQPAWSAEVITAFGCPMAAGTVAGVLAWLVRDSRRDAAR